MPVVSIGVRRLFSHLGAAKSMKELLEVLEALGCHVEDTEEVVLYACAGCGSPVEALQSEESPRRCPTCGYESAAPFAAIGKDQVVRIELLPARPDLFDAGGLARSIKGFLGLEKGLPRAAVEKGEILVRVDPALSRPESFRPHIACAEVEMPSLDAEGLRELMKLQESLHWGIGRDRKLASIGVYDLSRIVPPIDYRAVGPDETQFSPLGMPGMRLTPRRILAEHPKGVAYRHLLEKHARYPLLIDSKGQVLSLPPIINSDETKVSVGSRRLFVDVTGTTASDTDHALHAIVSSLVETGGKVRSVRISGPSGERETPELSPRSIVLSRPETERWLGIPLSPEKFRELLGRMRLGVEGGPDSFTVSYAAFRTDVKHPVDLMEDVAIAYGFRNMVLDLVPTGTVGRERPEEALSARARAALLGLGHFEVMTLVQTTEANHYRRLRLEPGTDHVQIANPKSIELDRVRTHLLSGLLEILEKNHHKPAPIRLFEIGNVILLDPSAETGTREIRRAGIALMGPEAGYAQIRAVVDGLLAELGRTGTYRAASHPTFLSGRFAEVDLGDGLTARLGELHPEVVLSFGLAHPTAMAEVDLCRVV
ncbi:MAG: phenylalanine--tRNA ligase subunit beta [Planctomycetes bacterium]|nr:phenylalanine--tRNA ligase subunit beta [Planctomycetota bacterium]